MLYRLCCDRAETALCHGMRQIEENQEEEEERPRGGERKPLVRKVAKLRGTAQAGGVGVGVGKLGGKRLCMPIILPAYLPYTPIHLPLGTRTTPRLTKRVHPPCQEPQQPPQHACTLLAIVLPAVAIIHSGQRL